MNEIKNHLKESGNEYLKAYADGIKFYDMGRYIKTGYNEFTECCDGTTMVKYRVRTKFKTKFKFDNNTVDWMVNIYSDGTIGIYFDGTEYIHAE